MDQENTVASFAEKAPLEKVLPPIERSDDAIARVLRHTPVQERAAWLRTILEGRTALRKMPEGKSGIVLGSGGNTPAWKERGWRTLDIDPATQADIVINAEKLSTVVMPASEDFIYAEAIRFDPVGLNGVGWGNLLSESNRVLKKGGILVIRTAHKENKPTSTLPNRKDYVKWMARHGFNTVVELRPIRTVPKPEGGEMKEQVVIYYGQKVADGVDESRLP